MTDDRGRAGRGAMRPGNVGRADPHADPATDPSMRPVDVPADPSGGPTMPVHTDPSGGPTVPVRLPADEPDVPAQRDAAGDTAPHRTPPEAPPRSRLAGLWIGLILSALVLLLLLVFILQNLGQVQIRFLGLDGNLPTGVALLFAAVAGVLLVAIPGSLRILQLRRAARRARTDRREHTGRKAEVR
ncbi:lipopolysaccharide assembly protein LapA domain-containing protein [Pseudonocardia sp.]|uniref:lipopolysaccharide assembly protein LapA domain-containing protein n=1 Tax=Pseudonocardia sp. TaxID=60912 RepID=UPI003D0B1F9B